MTQQQDTRDLAAPDAERALRAYETQSPLSVPDAPTSNYHKHAMREFRAAGWLNDDGTFKDEMQGAICGNVLALLDVFSGEGHSGSSAVYAVRLFEKLALFEPVVPLTGAEWEWEEVGNGVFQNIRCGRVFKQADRFDGQPYDINAVVFYDWIETPLEPDEEGYPGTRRFKSCFTNSQSRRAITFPYTPSTVYEEVTEAA